MSYRFSSKRRRPALACEECRRRKIKCDREYPCSACIKVKLPTCIYVREEGDELAEAPFQAADTQFSVFEQTLDGLVFCSGKNSYTDPSSQDQDHQMPLRIQGQETRLNILPEARQQQQQQQHPASEELTFESSGQSSFNPGSSEMPLPLSTTVSSSVFDSLPTPSWELPSLVDTPSTGSLTSEGQLYPSKKWGALGASYKNRYLGLSHWTHYAYNSSIVIDLIHSYEEKSGFDQWTFAKCKATRQAIKATRAAAITDSLSPFPQSTMPAKRVTDQLIRAYLKTFQGIFPVLFVPQFLTDYASYCKSPPSSRLEFSILLSLVLCIGSSCSTDGVGVSKASMVAWIKLAHSWLQSCKKKLRLSLDGLRIHCLLLIAQKSSGVSFEETTIGSCRLYHDIMQCDLYPIAVQGDRGRRERLEAELRRRLWAVIVEIDLQASMDNGSLSTVIAAIEDGRYPLLGNFQDVDLDHNNDEIGRGLATSSPASDREILPKPLECFTESSLSILLVITLPVRLSIARFLNSQNTEHSFDTALGLSAELFSQLKKCYELIDKYHGTEEPPTLFQSRMFDLLTRRFILSLHHPFALGAISDPRYCYSRQVCVDASRSLMAHISHAHEAQFQQLQLGGAGVFCQVYFQSALYLVGEMDNLNEKDGAYLNHAHPSTLHRGEMRSSLERYSRLSLGRIAAGETNIKRHVLFSCLLAQVDAKREASSISQAVTKALEKTLERCRSLLEAHLTTLVSSLQPMDEVTAAPNAASSLKQYDWFQWDELLGLNMSHSSQSSHRELTLPT